MGKNKSNISPVKRGMNRNTAPYLLQGMEYLFALNTNIQDEDSSVINITNEESNILATKFEEGFKVIGRRNDILTKGTYFFLVNPVTEESQFGVIKNNQIEEPDVLDDLNQPLEEVDQEPYEGFTVLINKGLNLNINYPVKKIVIKNEQCGTVIALTDNFNPPRLFILDKLENYLIKDKEVDPDKIAIFKKSLLPKINIQPLVTGGRLKRGTYEFLIAYTNKLGEEISEYTSITNPIPIFDKNDRILEQSELADRTNFAIKLNITNLDPDREYYKIVVIQNTDIEGGVSFFEEGVHPVSNTSIIYDSEENKTRTTLENIFKIFPYIKKWEGLTESDGQLMGYGITSEKEINLQPVVNLMGSFLKWQTSIAKESIYETGQSSSTTKGYMRNETYPFSLRVKFNNGYTTANFPFVSRPAEEIEYITGERFHELDNVPDSKDVQSIKKNNPECAKSNRERFWQYYNTASKEGRREVPFGFTSVQEPVTKSSLIQDLDEIPGQILTLSLDEPYEGLDNYISKHIDDEEVTNPDLEPLHPLYSISSYFEESKYENEHKIPEFEDCSSPELLEDRSEMQVGDVINERILEYIPKELKKYNRFVPLARGSIIAKDKDGGSQREDKLFYNIPAFQTALDKEEFKFAKVISLQNTECNTALTIPHMQYNKEYSESNVGSNTMFNDIISGWEVDEVLTEFTSVPFNVGRYESDDGFLGLGSEDIHLSYKNRVHKNALWFKTKLQSREDIVLEITKLSKILEHEAGAQWTSLRVTVFDDCENKNHLLSSFVDLKEGLVIDINVEDLNITGDSILIAVDTYMFENNGAFATSSTRGTYSIHTRDKEYSDVVVDFDKIQIDKLEVYRATCNFKIPNIEGCDKVPFEYGKFGYTESLEKYPNNKELYDSTSLKVDLNKVPESIQDDFKKYFIKINPDGSYQLNENANLTNKPIRHFKFPDNDVSSFISNARQASFSDNIIFPIGVHIDDEVVSAFLDIAVDNDFLTQEQRNAVTGYEIFRGDRTLEKSIEAKGLLYDNYQVEERDETVYFPNFPFNSLGKNDLMYENENRNSFIEHPFDSEGNNSFSFISPDNSFRKLSTPSELQLEGYLFGNSKTYFSDVEDHPKWTILGDKAYKLANTLATAETIAEIVIQIAEATIETSKNMWFTVGVANTGGNPIGSVVGGIATGVIAGFQILSNSVFKIARYRKEWLTTFRDLGQPENFAAFSTSVGEYNSLRSIPSIGNTLRGLDTVKDLKSGRFSFRHRDTGKKIILNNADREESTYIYLGEDFNLEYPYEYRSYDNYDLNSNYSSRTFASEENVCTTGQSPEILSNIASPYVSLKNYVPSQYGSIDSVRWLPTSYISYFDNNTDTIFGGDIFISRMSLKRKMPLFIRDAMKTASLTPFNYNFYSNIGSNRFFCNYEVSEEINLENSLFPDFKSTYNFDCLEGKSGFYVKPPSKFYLYYYGIPNFLVESEINSNFRYGKKEPRNNFYPNTGDIVNWTQENNVSIKEQNTFYYNFVYSRPVTSVNNRNLPFTYSKEEYDCKYDDPNGVMWSNSDNSEKDLSEPWLIYRPLDKHIFPSSFGKLKDLKGIENNVILGRFENQSAIFNKVDTRVEGINPEMGGDSMFRRVQTFTETDLGYLGTQTSDIISCEYGHFFPDAKRGGVFNVEPGGAGVEEISKYSGGKPNGMDKWFKKHLPFKVYNTLINNYENIDVDNAYNGIGISMGWDSKYKRIFLTKKDYIPLKEMNYENNNFFAAKNEFELITDYEADGYTYLGKEGYYYKFNKLSVTIPDTAKIYVVININDYIVEEAKEIIAEVNQWASELDDLDREVVIITTDSDKWLGITSQLISGYFNESYNQGEWNGIGNYNGQKIKKEGIILNFTNSSSYIGEEPTTEFINDYKDFISDFNKVDYLKTILITKNEQPLDEHLNKVLTNSDNYEDYPIRGTSPQQFIEPLNIYGVSHINNFDMNTEKALNEELGDEFSDGTILIKGDIIDVTNTDFFKDVSFTIAYQVETGSWLSYYSFEPNYYLSHNTYFQTGVNNQEGKEGIWSHNMSNKSYGVFYGEKYPWTIEYPIKNEFKAKRLQNVTFWTEAKRPINEYDFAYDRHITFNKAVVYNSYGNSGQLNLIPQRTLSQITKYPITREDSQDILITNQDFNWTFNNIYNRTLNQDGITSDWISDENQIDKTINNDLVRFGGKKILSYLRGEYFIVRLTQDESTQHNLILKWATNEEEIY